MTENNTHTAEDLHVQTARVTWAEIEVHFARGVVIKVGAELDLVEVATCFANDDREAVEPWLSEGLVQHLDTETARDWGLRDPELWAVVTAPWVLIQERES